MRHMRNEILFHLVQFAQSQGHFIEMPSEVGEFIAPVRRKAVPKLALGNALRSERELPQRIGYRPDHYDPDDHCNQKRQSASDYRDDSRVIAITVCRIHLFMNSGLNRRKQAVGIVADLIESIL